MFYKKRKDSTRSYNNLKWDYIPQDKEIVILNNTDNVKFYDKNIEEKIFFYQYAICPIYYNGEKTLIVHNPIIRIPVDLINKYIDSKYIIVMDANQIKNLLEENYELTKDKITFNDHEKPIDIVKKILVKMDKLGASDLTFSWNDTETNIIYTTDGNNLTEYTDIIDNELADKVRISLINISNENQANRIIDGKFSIYFGNKINEYRLSVVQTILGYSIVIRSYIERDSFQEIKELGYTDRAIEIINDIVESNRYGLFLITGPTGSGKTTAIYSIISNMQKKYGMRIKTAEDPVEVILPGIDQCQINLKGEPEHRITYEVLLQSFLRQRPDMIVIGEIRNKSVAQVTTEVALTGHFVISTLHTNNISATFTRLMDSMQVPADRIEDSVKGVLTQNLIPKLCDCKIKTKDGHYKANEKGCEKCSMTPGYSGLVPIVEVASLKECEKNYLQENFKHYYSFKDSAKDLFEDGIIDKETLNKI